MKCRKIQEILASTVIFTDLCCTTIANANITTSEKPFLKINASVNFTLTDRFNNGDTIRNVTSYSKGFHYYHHGCWY